MSIGAAKTASVNSTASSTTILSANPGRKGCRIHNTDANALLIKFGATATSSDFTARILASGSYVMTDDELYTGIIDGIWEGDGAGAAKTTEW